MTIKNRLDRVEQHERATARPGAILWSAGPDMWRWGSRLFTAVEVEELAITHDVIRIVEDRQNDD